MKLTKNFALIGAAGYIAPRHIQAIRDTKNNLVCACDPHDSVGILDKYFDNVKYFKEFERFDRFIEKERLAKSEDQIDYVTICSPNYLHDAHIRFGFRVGANVICEKPLVINPRNLDNLIELENLYNSKLNTVLQLRCHPSVIELKKKVDNGPKDHIYNVDLTYITSRGPWYEYSWKGDNSKSGGLVTNIGIHFFDILNWIFGEKEHTEVHYSDKDTIAGYIVYKKAKVRWFLSVNKKMLPDHVKAEGNSTYRSLEIDKEEFEFSAGFTDLHTKVYEDILNGKGYGIEDSRSAIEIVDDIRNIDLIEKNSNAHPLLDR
mgnify:CR=1 FL=1